jgi:hypothetical protein
MGLTNNNVHLDRNQTHATVFSVNAATALNTHLTSHE